MANISEKYIVYKFNNLELFWQALTHKSWVNENDKKAQDYQRLEFLGDSVLKLIQGNLLYTKYPEWSEGQLTQVRSAHENNKNLSTWTQQLKLDELIRHGQGIKHNSIAWENICAQVFEAMLGAIWTDCGQNFQIINDIYNQWLLHFSHSSINIKDISLSKQNTNDTVIDNPKKELQEYLQSSKIDLPIYSMITKVGPTHAPIFSVKCSIKSVDDYTISQGTSLKIAEQGAARAMLKKLKSNSYQINENKEFPIKIETQSTKELLKRINGSKICQPTAAPFIRYEKDDTIQTYSYYCKWDCLSLSYMMGHRGISSIFPIENLPVLISNLYRKCIGKYNNIHDRYEDIKELITIIFNSLKPYDDLVFTYNQKNQTINLPYNILMFKWLRELYCNPYILIHVFDRQNDELISGLRRILLNNEISEVDYKKDFSTFLYLASKYVKDTFTNYYKLWKIDNEQDKIIKVVDKITLNEVEQAITIANAPSYSLKETLDYYISFCFDKKKEFKWKDYFQFYDNK